MRRERACPASLLRLLWLGVLVLGCGRGKPPGPDVVAVVGGQALDHAEFQELIRARLGEDGSALTAGALSGLLDQMLDEEVLRRLAVERGLVSAQASRREAAERLLETSLEDAVSPGEALAYYQRHREEFRRPARVRLRQILVEDRATAERAADDLARGAAFDEVARRLSIGPGAPRGGLQGDLTREDLPPAFADTIFELRPGEVSPIVAADYGFHIFTVESRSPAESIPFQQAEAAIRSRLRREAADRTLARLLAEGHRRYNVVVHAQNLPFPYRGEYAKD